MNQPTVRDTSRSPTFFSAVAFEVDAEGFAAGPLLRARAERRQQHVVDLGPVARWHPLEQGLSSPRSSS